jgi:hypothetical protein
MFHIYAKYSLLSILFITTGISAIAQPSRANKENSPYSAYGIGEEQNSINTLMRGMGSISAAYSNPYAVNTDNPASYGGLKLTTYEAGGMASSRMLKSGNDKYSTGRASFSYFNIGIPLGKHMGIAFGLKPYTREYFRLDDTVNFIGLGNAYKSFIGDGSTNYGFIGLGAKYNGFSIGANFGYLFGTIETSNYIIALNSDSSKTSNSEFSRYTKIGGIYWKAGAMYEHALQNKKMIRFGATTTLSQQLNATTDDYWITHSTVVTLYDTAYRLDQVKGKIKLPLSYSAGVQLLSDDKWMAGIDYSGAQWSQFRSYGVADSVANSYKIAIGGEYTPNALSLHKYLQRVTYRLGFYYGADQVKLRNTQLKYFAVTAGASLPFRHGADRLHTAIEVGARGTEDNGLLRENFVKFSLGISFNDKWFIKRKYD